MRIKLTAAEVLALTQAQLDLQRAEHEYRAALARVQSETEAVLRARGKKPGGGTVAYETSGDNVFLCIRKPQPGQQ